MALEFLDTSQSLITQSHFPPLTSREVHGNRSRRAPCSHATARGSQNHATKRLASVDLGRQRLDVLDKRRARRLQLPQKRVKLGRDRSFAQTADHEGATQSGTNELGVLFQLLLDRVRLGLALYRSFQHVHRVVQALCNGSRSSKGKLLKHQVNEDLDLRSRVVEGFEHTREEGVDVEPRQAGIKEGIHRLESGLRDVQNESALKLKKAAAHKTYLANLKTVVDLVLERTHLDYPNQLLPDVGLLVKQRKQFRERVANQVRLVVSGRVQRGKGNTTDVLKRREELGLEHTDKIKTGKTHHIRVPHQLQKGRNQRREQAIVFLVLRVVGKGVPDGRDNSRPRRCLRGPDSRLQIRKELGRTAQRELAQRLGDNVPGPFFGHFFGSLEEERPQLLGVRERPQGLRREPERGGCRDRRESMGNGVGIAGLGFVVSLNVASDCL